MYRPQSGYKRAKHLLVKSQVKSGKPNLRNCEGPVGFFPRRMIDMPAVANQIELITSMRVCNKLSLFNAHALIAF